jgi:hypothetical protein
VQVVQPPAKAKSPETIDPETGEVIPAESNDDDVNEATDVEATPIEQNDAESPTDNLPQDPTGDYSAVNTEAVTPPQVVPATPTEDGSQQIDFPSTVQPQRPMHTNKIPASDAL